MKKKSTREKQTVLTINEIKDLGGTEDDLKLISGVDDDSGSECDYNEDLDSEPVKRDEIRDFIQKLQIFKHRPADERDDDDDGEIDDEIEGKTEGIETTKNDEVEPPKPGTSSESKKKKKEKNKYKVQHDEITSTTKDPTVEYNNHIKNYQRRKQMLIKDGDSFDDMKSPEKIEKLSDAMVQQMEEFASKLLQDEVAVYNKNREHTKRSNERWMKTVLTSGTLADKIAALTVLIQESPVHSLTHLDTLLNMMKKKGRRENLQATDALKEIFLSDNLPSNRKLCMFSQRPLYSIGPICGWNKDTMDKKLILWYYESELKKKYSEFVHILQQLAHDTVLTTRQKVVTTVYILLVNKPEQEKALLTLLINKVGDPHYKLASKVSSLLTKVVEKHPNMKGVVTREVEYLVFRPNIGERAQYYSVCFLNQIRLNHGDKDLAGKLIHIYFSFFKAFIKKGEVDTKMMSGLLSGVNRAYPYAQLEEEFLSNHLNHLYKIVHIVNFTTSVQALTLLFQVMDTNKTTSERYYNALYKKLTDPALKVSSKQAVFLNLLYKSIKKDDSERRVKAFIKRLLQVCSYQQPQFICGALVLLSELLKEKKVKLSITHSEEDSDEEEHFVDVPDQEDETVDENTTVEKEKDNEENSKTEDNENNEPNKDNIGNVKKRGASWVHRANLNHNCERTDYDPFHRNPQYCHAEKECIWELEKLSNHFHPTVNLFAHQILKGQAIKYTGDPLQDFTMIRFLDRFVFKNPKKVEDIKEHSLKFRLKTIPTGVKGMQVTSEDFLNLEENRVPADDMFLFKYFQQKAVRDENKSKDDDSDVESVSDTEFDDYLDKYENNIDGEDFDVDFSSEFGKKISKELDSDSDDDDDDDGGDDNNDNDDVDLSDEEIDFDDEDDELARAFKAEMEGSDDDDDDGDFADADDYYNDDGVVGGEPKGFDEENIEFSDDDEFQDFMPKGKKRKAESPGKTSPTKRGKKSKSKGGSGMHASAEEFATLIDETASSKYLGTGADALANPDKADVKQLKWEADRDRWIKGGNRFKKGKFSHKGGSGPNRGNKHGKFKKSGGGKNNQSGGWKKSAGFRNKKKGRK
ncbi:hypothetical protein ACF0H5_002264 [Mactra antiquata]